MPMPEPERRGVPAADRFRFNFTPRPRDRADRFGHGVYRLHYPTPDLAYVGAV